MAGSTGKKLILLEQWGAAHFEPAPSLWTLRAMARTGKISPNPVKVGKAYYVDPDARVVDPNRAPTLVERLQQAA
jgi:hypothetical protein